MDNVIEPIMLSRNDLGLALQETRFLAKKPVRTVPFFKHQTVTIKLPEWLQTDGDDQLNDIFNNQRKLFQQGSIVWGQIVQANNLLFNAGNDDCPAAIIYSLDPAIDCNSHVLKKAASGLFSVKGEHVENEEMQRFSDLLEDELERQMKLHVPLFLTKNIQCYYTTIMVCRNHLPNKILSNDLFPLLVLPEQTEATMILPKQYWSDTLIQCWG